MIKVHMSGAWDIFTFLRKTCYFTFLQFSQNLPLKTNNINHIIDASLK